MPGYFAVCLYVNIRMFENPALPSVVVAAPGGVLMLLIALKPASFRVVTVLFSAYADAVLYLTA
jgi:hypothetical protein